MKPTPTDVNRAPVIDDHLPASYTVKEGKSFSLTCRYSAFPRVDVVWLRDNQQIDLNLMGLSKDFKARKLNNSSV